MNELEKIENKYTSIIEALKTERANAVMKLEDHKKKIKNELEENYFIQGLNITTMISNVIDWFDHYLITSSKELGKYEEMKNEIFDLVEIQTGEQERIEELEEENSAHIDKIKELEKTIKEQKENPPAPKTPAYKLDKQTRLAEEYYQKYVKYFEEKDYRRFVTHKGHLSARKRNPAFNEIWTRIYEPKLPGDTEQLKEQMIQDGTFKQIQDSFKANMQKANKTKNPNKEAEDGNQH